MRDGELVRGTGVSSWGAPAGDAHAASASVSAAKPIEARFLRIPEILSRHVKRATLAEIMFWMPVNSSST